jgi:ligand-binding sensor domain-containing protein/serine phosphatase RsbU (regulator of sigma subunit)
VNWRTHKKILPVLLLLCFWISTKAQQLDIKNFSIEDGLPQSQIMNICQDHSGVIWFSTNGGGVSRFDGIKFSNFSTRDGLRSNRVNVVYEDRSSTMWIGTGKGVAIYRNKQLTAVRDELLDDKAIYSIFQDGNGSLWFGTSTGIVIFDGKKFSQFEKNPEIGNFQVWAIKPDNIGNIWIGTMFNGVFKYDRTRMIHFGEESGLLDLKNRDILINGDKVWIATYHGISIYDPSKAYTGNIKLDTLKVDGKPYTTSVFRLYKDMNDAIWTGNNDGVDRIINNKIRAIRPENGLCNNRICGMIQDREGDMWFGSFSGGVSKYRNDLFININEKHGLANNTVMSFLKDSKDNMWIGTWGGGVSRLDFNAFRANGEIKIQNFGAKKEESGVNNVWSMCEDKKGNIWFGTSGSGITVYDGKTFRLYHLKDGLHGIRIVSMLCDKQGNVWIAHENGLDKFNGSSFEFYSSTLGFPSQEVSAIYEDNLGQLWFGMNDRIVKYDDGTYLTIKLPTKLPKIRNIINDRFGYIWLSTDAGIVVYNGTSFKTIGEAEGLSSNTVYYIQPDANGDLWMGTNNGIDKLDLNAFVNEKEVRLKHYGKEEGFMGLECNQNAFYKDIDGKLWIGTVGGVTIFDPRQERKNTIEPQTQINGIRLFLERFDYKKYSDSLINGLPANLRLPYDKNHITFDFIGISHTIPSKVRYQFMLEGFDQGWLPIGKETSTTYSNLSPGKYTFLLRSCNNDDLWNAAPCAFTFEIIPPFWKRPWFYVLAIAIGVGGIFLLMKMRERGLRAYQRRLEEQVAIRTRELSAEKEKLQSAYSEIDGKNKDITDSIHYAKRIQYAILPPDSAVRQAFPESFVLYQPKAIVSGDFYWLEKWGNETLIAAVDCTGHGVPGAFMSIVGHNILTQAVNVLGLTKPSLILNETNKQLSKKLNQDPEEATVRDGMDIALVAINRTKMKVEFAGANNPMWIIRDNQVIQVSGDKFPIGAFVGEELQQFSNHEYELQAGDCIYIFTDGYADQFGLSDETWAKVDAILKNPASSEDEISFAKAFMSKGKKFKYKRLQELLLEHHQKPFDEQKRILEKTIENWRGSLEQIDDVLVIGIRI